ERRAVRRGRSVDVADRDRRARFALAALLALTALARRLGEHRLLARALEGRLYDRAVRVVARLGGRERDGGHLPLGLRTLAPLGAGRALAALRPDVQDAVDSLRPDLDSRRRIRARTRVGEVERGVALESIGDQFDAAVARCAADSDLAGVQDELLAGG